MLAGVTSNVNPRSSSASVPRCDAILALLFFEAGTSAYLWAIVLYEPIGRHVLGPVAVWNGAAIVVLTAQAPAAVVAIVATLVVQTR